MNVVSLFDGISAGRVALDRAFIKVNHYYASEIDQDAMLVSQNNFPDIERLPKVERVTRSLIEGDVDLLLGGSPCQGFSFAGHRLNFLDPRSRLFFEYIRLLRELNPLYFLFENVPMSKRCEGIISDYLECYPTRLNSSLVSAQNRERLYWTNIPFVGVPINKGIKLQDILESGEVDRDKSYCIDANYYKGGSQSYLLRHYDDQYSRQIILEGNRVRILTPLECERLQTFPDYYTYGVSNNSRYKLLGNSWTVDIISWFFSFLPEECRRRGF